VIERNLNEAKYGSNENFELNELEESINKKSVHDLET